MYLCLMIYLTVNVQMVVLLKLWRVTTQIHLQPSKFLKPTRQSISSSGYSQRMSFKSNYKSQVDNNSSLNETQLQDHQLYISRFSRTDLTTNLIGANSRISIVCSWKRVTLIQILNKSRIIVTVIRRWWSKNKFNKRETNHKEGCRNSKLSKISL